MRLIVAGLLMVLGGTTAYAIDEDNADFLLPYCKLTNQELIAIDHFGSMLNANCYGIVSGVRTTVEQMRIAQMVGRASRLLQRI